MALVGAWLSHNLEYLRVWGVHRWAGAALSSLHMYMVPAGAGLLVAAIGAVRSTIRLARRLERRLADLRGHTSPRSTTADWAVGARTSWSFSVSTLVVVVWLLQVGLYLAQENVEASLGHLPAPGWGALTGVHALAPLVHLAVTLTLVTGLSLLRRPVTALAAALRAVETWLRSCRSLAAVAPPAPGKSWTPVQRWGCNRWCRPPPLAVGS